MKYISHKLIIDEESFQPQFEIKLSVNLEAIQDGQILMNKDEVIKVFGIGFLEILNEIKNHKATNEIPHVTGSELKRTVQDGK